MPQQLANFKAEFFKALAHPIRIIPVDGYIPGCPPTPAMLVTGILEVLQRGRS